MPQMSIHENVRAFRKKKGLTQEELAELAKLTVRTIQRIESGETVPRPFTIKAIAAVLDTSFDALQAADGSAIEQSVFIDAARPVHRQQDNIHFLKLVCLSCFSYLAVPFVHFLIPLYLLRKHNDTSPDVGRFARSVIRRQIYWVISLHLLLLLTLGWNTFSAMHLNRAYLINYLLPFFAMYVLNAVIIFTALVEIRNQHFA